MNKFEKWLLHLSTAVLGVSGAGFWWMKHLMEPIDPFAVVNHLLQPWFLASHILVAPVVLFAVGLIAREHIWKESRRPGNRNRRIGFACFTALGVSGLSGYLLQTTVREGLRLVFLWVHLSSGAVYLAAYLIHLAFALRLARRRRRGMLLVSDRDPRYNAGGQETEEETTPTVEGLA